MKKIKLINNFISECVASNFLFFKIKRFFEVNNYELVEDFDEASYIVMNTCGVTSFIENKFLDYIKDLFKKYGEKSKIIVFGCLPSVSVELKKLDSIVLIPLKKEKLFESFFEYKVSLDKIDGVDINGVELTGTVMGDIDDSNTKNYYLYVSRGCIHACSYCVIKRSIGFVKSEPLEKIYNECANAIKRGYNNIILVSDDLGSYGIDIGISFDILFNKLCTLDGDYFFNISYIEPSTMIKIFPKIKHNFRKVSSINIPIQSGSNRILYLMNRKYTIESIINLIAEIRKYGSPDLVVLNHIIYLYPTETHDEFLKSIQIAKYYDKNLFIIYSYRNGLKKIKAKEFSMSERRERVIFLKKLSFKYGAKISLANPF